jgi:hypothetical protein
MPPQPPSKPWAYQTRVNLRCLVEGAFACQSVAVSGRALLVSATAFCGTCAVAVVVASAASGPVLGHPWGPYQQGYGELRPSDVFNGGDPTGAVSNIRWSSWGSPSAVGTGTSVYVWPGTAVASNGPTPGARIVAFHLGRCRGIPSYNAVEWFYPRYGERFNPHRYINACTGTYVGSTSKLVSCAVVPLSDGNAAFQVSVAGMSCSHGRALIATGKGERYLGGGRYLLNGFRCGTDGPPSGDDTATFECTRNDASVFWSETLGGGVP